MTATRPRDSPQAYWDICDPPARVYQWLADNRGVPGRDPGEASSPGHQHQVFQTTGPAKRPGNLARGCCSLRCTLEPRHHHTEPPSWLLQKRRPPGPAPPSSPPRGVMKGATASIPGFRIGHPLGGTEIHHRLGNGHGHILPMTPSADLTSPATRGTGRSPPGARCPGPPGAEAEALRVKGHPFPGSTDCRTD